jgi:hypothetical protein
MTGIREAATRLLEDTSDDLETLSADMRIERITCDVQLGRQSELVTLRIVDSSMQTACTCARPACPHVRLALQLLAARASGERHSVRTERVSVELRVAQERSRRERAAALTEPLTDLVTAVARAGVASERIASVLDGLARVERALPTPLPLGLSRWLGCLREALEARDVALTAHALHGATRLCDDLRSPTLDAQAHARIGTWLGSGADELVRLSDRHMVEVAREWVTGRERHELERRYLLDLESGEMFREESARRDGSSSLGPCPRSLGVSLAEVELGSAPRRLRLLQYTTTPVLERKSWEALANWAQRDVRQTVASFETALQQVGVLAEPFVLLAPQGLERGALPRLLFEQGPALSLAADDEPAVLRRLEILCSQQLPTWLAGRLHLRAGQVVLRPLAAGIMEPSGLRHERL